MGLVLHIATGQPSSVASARLARVVAQPKAAWPIRPLKIQAWLAQFENKLFVGKLEDGRFKLVLLRPTVGAKLRRGRSVVLSGSVENGVVNALLRPPVFYMVFAALFTFALTFAFILSYYGPSNTNSVRLLLAAMLILPMAGLVLAFRMEAHLVESALRRALAEPAAAE